MPKMEFRFPKTLSGLQGSERLRSSGQRHRAVAPGYKLYGQTVWGSFKGWIMISKRGIYIYPAVLDLLLVSCKCHPA